jgi:hypothetical protein
VSWVNLGSRNPCGKGPMVERCTRIPRCTGIDIWSSVTDIADTFLAPVLLYLRSTKQCTMPLRLLSLPLHMSCCGSLERWKRKPDAYHTVLYTVAIIHFHPLEYARKSCKNKSCRWIRVMRWDLKVQVHMHLPIEKRASSSSAWAMSDE